MRGTDRLQKVLYVIMILLGIYIVYKAGSIVLGSPAVRSLFDSGSMQRNLEDAAVRTWAPGYAAAIERSDQDGEKWAGAWMDQLMPAYSFLADGQASAPEETESGTEQTADRPESEPGQTETDGAQAESEPGQTETDSAQAENAPEAGTGTGEAAAAFSGSAVSDTLMEQLQDFDYLL